MAQFSINTTRIDLYKNFKFQLAWEDGTVVAGVSKVSALKRTTEVVSHREGGDVSAPRHSPGKSSFEPITVERGVTHDPAFEEWANLVYSTSGDAAVSLAGYKRNLLLNVFNLQGQVVKSYRIFRAWVSEYTALPELDANGNAVMFETIVLQNEGWERDPGTTEVRES
jgi:phage tail-like protein